MTRIALGVLVMVHGLMRPSHSWLLGEQRLTSLVVAVLAGFLIIASGIGILSHQDWWAVAGLVGAALSLVSRLRKPLAMRRVWAGRK